MYEPYVHTCTPAADDWIIDRLLPRITIKLSPNHTLQNTTLPLAPTFYTDSTPSFLQPIQKLKAAVARTNQRRKKKARVRAITRAVAASGKSNQSINRRAVHARIIFIISPAAAEQRRRRIKIMRRVRARTYTYIRRCLYMYTQP